jgi:uncharacterized RDD family membrane protein YckC
MQPQNIISIQTSQNIELEYPMATVSDRIAAQIIDWLILVGYTILVYVLIDGSHPPDAVLIGVFLPAVFYGLLCEVFFGGQTIGKRALNIRVIRLDGTPPSLSSYLLRWVMSVLEVNPAIFFGLPAMLAASNTKHSQRLGDLLAGTTVIKLRLVTTFADTIFVETYDGYQVKFPEIRTLADKDLAILKDVLEAGLDMHNYDLLDRLTKRVKAVTGITSNLPNETFLRTLLADYNHIYGRA